jgi:hypothetical protein
MIIPWIICCLICAMWTSIKNKNTITLKKASIKNLTCMNILCTQPRTHYKQSPQYMDRHTLYNHKQIQYSPPDNSLNKNKHLNCFYIIKYSIPKYLKCTKINELIKKVMRKVQPINTRCFDRNKIF